MVPCCFHEKENKQQDVCMSGGAGGSKAPTQRDQHVSELRPHHTAVALLVEDAEPLYEIFLGAHVL